MRRRKIFGAIGLLGATVWVKPVVNSVVLPSHAVTSAQSCDDSLEPAETSESNNIPEVENPDPVIATPTEPDSNSTQNMGTIDPSVQAVDTGSSTTGTSSGSISVGTGNHADIEIAPLPPVVIISVPDSAFLDLPSEGSFISVEPLSDPLCS